MSNYLLLQAGVTVAVDYRDLGSRIRAKREIKRMSQAELASDIVEKGIILAGGGALIQNLDKLLSKETNMPVYIADNPLECVVKGAGKTLEDLERLKKVLINARRRR